jgi:hypothetical protein
MSQFLSNRDFQDSVCEHILIDEVASGDTLARLAASQFPTHTVAQQALVAGIYSAIVSRIRGSPSWTPTAVSTLLAIARRVVFQAHHEFASALTRSEADAHCRRTRDVMQRLLLRHSIQRPPFSVALFSLPLLQEANEILLDVIFRDFDLLAVALSRERKPRAATLQHAAELRTLRVICPCCATRRMRVLGAPVTEAAGELAAPAEAEGESLASSAPVVAAAEAEVYADESGASHRHEIVLPAVVLECPECLVQLHEAVRAYTPCRVCAWWPRDETHARDERARKADRIAAALTAAAAAAAAATKAAEDEAEEERKRQAAAEAGADAPPAGV